VNNGQPVFLTAFSTRIRLGKHHASLIVSGAPTDGEHLLFYPLALFTRWRHGFVLSGSLNLGFRVFGRWPDNGGRNLVAAGGVEQGNALRWQADFFRLANTRPSYE
jgi:hypothetical protein